MKKHVIIPNPLPEPVAEPREPRVLDATVRAGLAILDDWRAHNAPDYLYAAVAAHYFSDDDFVGVAVSLARTPQDGFEPLPVGTLTSIADEIRPQSRL